MSSPFRGASLGADVFYVDSEYVTRDEEIVSHLKIKTARITEVFDDLTVNLVVFDTDEIFFPRQIKYCETNRSNTWHWPDMKDPDEPDDDVV